MKKYCARCMKFHDVNYQCISKPQRQSKIKETEARKFRATYKWTSKSLEIRERDKYLCAVCREQGIYNYKRLSVHHIIPLEEDTSKGLDDDNLITLCYDHHTQAEAGEITRAYLKSLVIEEQGSTRKE